MLIGNGKELYFACGGLLC